MRRNLQSGGIFFTLLMIFWRGALALGRLMWTVVYRHSLRKCGAETWFGSAVYIDNPKRVAFGARCYVGQGVKIGAEIAEGELDVANDVQISEGCRIDYSGTLRIEDGVLISRDVSILTHDHGYNPRSKPHPFPLVIGKSAWIGMGVMILPGTEYIGQGAIIGAGAVVTRPVPDGAIVVGYSAQVIKERPQ